MQNNYDAIVIGARCAGSPTAMLLAKKGYKVLLVDKATFPSDTISTHIIWHKGVSLLRQWGLLESVLASNCVVMHEITCDFGPFAITGSPPPVNDTYQFIAPRRTVLDKILVDAAVRAGAEVRENCLVDEILMEADCVTGIRSRTKGGVHATDKARIVVGADGKNSLLARTVGAMEYHAKASLTCWYYTYWSGIPVENLVLYSQPNRAIAIIPTNDGLVCIPAAWPANEFRQYRADIERNYMTTLCLSDELAGLIQKGRREARFIGMADLPNFFRKSFGKGWVLAGDAGYHKDPITGQGISDAFQSAAKLADTLDIGLSGKESLDTLLAKYEEDRDESTMAMYEFTCDWATLAPLSVEMEHLLSALRGNQPEVNRFCGTIAGTVAVADFYSPENIERILGSAE